MAFGDIGGAVTELVITCKTPASGAVNIAPGDALKLTGPYTVTNATSAEDPIFGQALAACAANDASIPVKIRGICIFGFTGGSPVVDGAKGIVASATAGKVKAPTSGAGHGINVKVDVSASLVHVLF